MTTLTITQASCADDYDPNSMPVDKARAFIHTFLTPIAGVARVPIRSALGRVLAMDIISPVNVPAHRNSAMDGWALRFADLGASDTTLTEVGASFAGKPYVGTLGNNQCVRIFTGGVVPPECDTVIMQERATASAKTITFAAGAKRGQNVREAGEDLRQGAVALARGRIVRPAELGLMASLGIGEISVHRPLRVAYFSTGDELVSIGNALAEGEIYDSNRYTLHGMLQRMGIEAIDMGVVRDDPALLEQAFRDAAAIADVVITSGGVSVGEADYVKTLLSKLGEVVFWKIAMKPGRPLAYGKIGNCHFFGLPGNPVSSFVTWLLAVSTVLRTMQGLPAALPTGMSVRADFDWGKPDKRREFLRVRFNAEGGLDLYPNQSSGVLTSAVWADGLLDNPPGQAIRRGDSVRFLPLSELVVR